MNLNFCRSRAVWGPLTLVLVLALGLGLWVSTLLQAVEPPADPASPTATEPTAADPAAVALYQKVVHAYQQVPTYQGRTVFTIRQPGRGTQTMPAITVAFDRAGQRLRVQRPDLTLAADGQRLRMVFNALPPGLSARHLEIQDYQPLNYEMLTQRAEPLATPLLPDLALLLGADLPAKAKELRLVRGEAAEGVAPQGLQMKLDDGTTTLWLDPQSHLVQRLELVPDTTPGRPQMTVEGVIQVEPEGTELADDLFTVETAGSQAMPSMEAMYAAWAGEAEASRPPHPLVGQVPPAVELTLLDGKPFSLTQAQQANRVVVLDFWATWCGPCRQAMPVMQSLQNWAEKEGHAVQVYAVNLRETPEQIRPFLKQMGLSMPVVLDKQGAAARAYGVEGIPTSVVISGGRVAHVHVGFGPGLEARLFDQVKTLLGAKPAETDADAEPAAPKPAEEEAPASDAAAGEEE